VAKTKKKPVITKPIITKKIIPKILRQKTNLIKYEMLLCRIARVAFVTQRLEFNASRNINKAWQEAQALRLLLVRVGDFKRRDIKIIAFGLKGALQAYQTEYRIKLTHDPASLQAAVGKLIKLEKIKRR
jgi:hypothetical protein